MDGARTLRFRSYWALVALAGVSTTGCVGLLANILYPGNLVPPAFDGLEHRRVAVVCRANTGDLGPSSAATVVPRLVSRLLKQYGKHIEVVDQQEIDQWTDTHGWDQIDFREIGRGVHADMVVGIDIASISLREGATLYKGTADVRTTVYDMTREGAEVYHGSPAPVIYPRNSGYHTADVREDQFRRMFFSVIAREIAKDFYSYNLQDDIAVDKPDVGF